MQTASSDDVYLAQQNGPWAGDDKLFVQFSIEPLQNEQKSLEAGRPIFEDVEFIRIQVPGDKDSIYFQPVTDEDRRRFANRYQRWKQNQKDEQVTGTPLSEIAFLSRSMVEELKAFGVRTAEQLVGMPDSNAQNFRGMSALKQKVRAYLDAAAGAAPAAKLQAELEQRDSQIASLKRALEEQGKKLEELLKRKG